MDSAAQFRSRRMFLGQVACCAASLMLPGALARGVFAEELERTPRQTEGPFYPTDLPLDTDNDLIVVNDAITPAVGEITHLSGRILDLHGDPIRNAIIEIWQVDNNGAYLHRNSDHREKLDKNFQGFGRFLTGTSGEYYFRTIKPVAYPGRTPHIHVKVKVRGAEALTTQCYIRGHPLNDRDGILRSIRDRRARESVIVDFTPIADSTINELAAKFDIVLGLTPKA